MTRVPLKIVVASNNPAKLRAVEEAFRNHYSDKNLEFIPARVDSGVKDQPDCDEETRRGAHQRAHAAQAKIPDADFWVGLEGGLERIGDEWMGSAWMVVRDSRDRVGQARTPTLPLPPAVQTLLDEGLELGDANDRVFRTHNSKQAGGAYGLLTEGVLTRSGVYAQAITLALIPLVHDLWKGRPDA